MSTKTTFLVLAGVIAAVVVALAIPVLAGAFAPVQRSSPLHLDREQLRAGPGGAVAGFEKHAFWRNFTGKGLAPRFRFPVGFELSSEYENRVRSIIASDPDTSKLLQQGFNVTAIKPIVTGVVQGTGDVSLKAKQALVILRGPSGYATVLVDVEQGKVLRVVTLTRTVITKE